MQLSRLRLLLLRNEAARRAPDLAAVYLQDYETVDDRIQSTDPIGKAPGRMAQFSHADLGGSIRNSK
jgi:hypothetical protein